MSSSSFYFTFVSLVSVNSVFCITIARALFNLLEWRFEGVPWPSVTLSWMDMVPTIVKRINEASATYQMFSVLGDIILINE